MQILVDRYHKIVDQVRSAETAAGRREGEVTLIAVSKNHPAEAIQTLYDAGHRDFGESKAQEFLAKKEVLPHDIRWHFIGKLQSNKAKRVGNTGATIHTLESESQLKELAKVEGAVEALTELNLGREAEKSGIFAETLDVWTKLVLQYSNVHLRGLMTIGPVVDDPEESRLLFRELVRLGKERGYQMFSMGMSADFEVAIQEGSTHIRIGTAIFGER